MKVSVIVPTYNYGKFLSRALQSIIKQTHNDIEIIVIDDASTDDTQDIVKSYPQVIYKRNSVNLGVSASRNKGIEIASGDIITFLDADDWLQPDAIERQLPYFADPSIGVVYPLGVRFVNTTGKILAQWNSKLVHSGIVTDKLFAHMFMHIGALIRMSVIGNDRFREDMKLSEDWWFFMILSFKCKFQAVKEYLYMYSTHEKQATSVDVISGLDIDIQARKEFAEKYKISDTAKKKFAFNMLIENGYWYRNVDKWKSLSFYSKAMWMCPFCSKGYIGLAKTLVSFFILIPNLNNWRENAKNI